MQLRQADVNEVAAATGKAPEDALRESIDNSISCFVILHEGEVIAVFGLSEGDGWVTPWMLATDNLVKHKRELLPVSRAVVSEWSKDHYVLFNHVDSRNTSAILWLRWLGFHVHTDCPLTLHDPAIPFLPFTLYQRHS